MRLTDPMYREAVGNLNAAVTQLDPDGRECAVCGDGGHQAWECGHNPLVAVRLCEAVAGAADRLHGRLHAVEDTLPIAPGTLREVVGDIHHFLHWLSGYEQAFGVQLGPRKVVVPHPVHGAHPATTSEGD